MSHIVWYNANTVNTERYDIIIIGGGPAGAAAAVYAARKKLKTLLIAESFGGQSIVSDDIQNWIGEPHISGFDLAKKLEAHVRAYADDVNIQTEKRVTEIKPVACEDDRPCDFDVVTDAGDLYRGKALILAIGGRRRKLNVPGEQEFDGKGVVYCSTCDAPLFRDKTVAVVGGGNAGMEAVIDLFPYAKKIYLLQRSNILKADKGTQEKVRENEKVEILLNARIKKIEGETFITGLIYEDVDGKEQKLDIEGVFVEIGSVPNSEIVKDIVELDRYGQIKIDSKLGTTSHQGVFAAGDITDDPYKQNNISAGDGVKSALAAYAYLQGLQKKSPAEEKE